MNSGNKACNSACEDTKENSDKKTKNHDNALFHILKEYLLLDI